MPSILAPYRQYLPTIPPEPEYEDWYDTFVKNRGVYEPPQAYDWTCSACALQFVLRTCGLDPSITRTETVYKIGYPEQINENYGLTNINGPGQALRDVLSLYGIETVQGWLSFEETYDLAANTTALMSGTNWYHWIAVRGTSGDNIWIANSAPGYRGIYDLLDSYDFHVLGPFNVVYLVR